LSSLSQSFTCTLVVDNLPTNEAVEHRIAVLSQEARINVSVPGRIKNHIIFVF